MELSQASQVAQIQLFPCSGRPVSTGPHMPLLWLWPYVCLGGMGRASWDPEGLAASCVCLRPRCLGVWERASERGHCCFQMGGNLPPKSCGLN